ncbi:MULTISPECIES: MFS transporter [Devosia]|uniref:Inner membrane protein YbjJ n=1 Tax=Devosia equisanguinis TaxID=2490941 RepID=A0A447I6L2_9HYPH|nr:MULTISPECIES: MFS transporter [Devosia]ODT48155.1 MAG: MFS transporter [Pelagibacterium sp. SCN 63-126]ODU85393.1 MAG: MFS transporter [Pelagibacterium sp. SCN 63-17]OJX42136.1 MAG: MFS transporter [Devosia sp. 63-57]VDS03161.1 Inner membrane protein YbjJ [Devosia equisanguinis]
MIAAQHRIYACFFLFAVTTGALMARLPDIQTHLGVSEGQLGLTMIGMAIGSLISLTLGAPIIEKLGFRTTAFITTLGPAVLFATIPWLPSAPAMFGVLFVVGLLSGALEINLNVEIDRLETQTGKRFMNRAHGFWSVGFFITALFGAMIRQSGLTPALHMGIVAAIVVLVGGYLIYGATDAPRTARSQSEADGHRFAFPNLGLLPLCLIGFAAFLVEGAGIDWSAIYMRNVFAVEPFVGGMGLTLFAFFMAAMRLSADPIVARFGPRNVAMVLLSLASVGALLVGTAPTPELALLGFSLMGIGCSAVYPLAVSAAAQRTDRPAAVNVAALGQVSFVVFFLAPPLLGFVAEFVNIRASYLICLPLLLAGLWAASFALGTRNTATPHGLPPEPLGPNG